MVKKIITFVFKNTDTVFQELQAEIAAERLAERLHIKLETYNPEGVDMRLVHELTLLARGDFYPLLITFAISLDPDQCRQNFSPDLNPNHLTL